MRRRRKYKITLNKSTLKFEVFYWFEQTNSWVFLKGGFNSSFYAENWLNDMVIADSQNPEVYEDFGE